MQSSNRERTSLYELASRSESLYSSLMLDGIHIWQIQRGNEPNGIKGVTRRIMPECCIDPDKELTSRNDIISAYLGVPAKDIRYDISPFGKPSLKGSDLSFEFNISHSHEIELIAMSCGIPIGIDIERMRCVKSMHKIAAKYFTRNESNVIFSKPQNEQLSAFFRCWTRKEAFVKAIGLGFQTTLSIYETHPEINGIANIDNIDTGRATGWCISDICVASGYIAALSKPYSNMYPACASEPCCEAKYRPFP